MTVPSEGVAVSVIVINFNGGTTLLESLKSIRESIAAAGLNAELIIVDNASDDGSADIVVSFAAANSATAIVNDHNAGYASAINQAGDRARGTYLAVCNMDIVAAEGWLTPLVNWLEEHPETGAVSPLLLLPDGLINACGQDIHVTALGFNRLFGAAAQDAGAEPMAVSGIHGAAFVMRRATLQWLGGLDATGFLYHEDVNLSWRLRLAGYDLYCIPTARVRHDYLLSMYPLKFYLLERNRLAMLATYLRPSTAVLLLPALLLTETMAWAYATLRGPRFLVAKWRSYSWVWKGRTALTIRRLQVASQRRRSDWQVIRTLRWRFRWRQFASLAVERGTRRGRLLGHLPSER